MMAIARKHARTKKQSSTEVVELSPDLNAKLDAESLEHETTKKKLLDQYTKIDDETTKLQKDHVSTQDLNAKLKTEILKHEIAKKKLCDKNTKLEAEALKHETAKIKLRDKNTKLEAEALKLETAKKKLQNQNTKLEAESIKHENAKIKLRDQNTHLEAEALKLLTDSLTGAYIRQRLFELGECEIIRARKDKQFFSILIFDIDFFKTINDTYGHEAGDRVLKSTIQTIAKHIRDVDILGRLGGDEFVVIFPQTGIEQAHKAAENLRKTLEEHAIELEDQEIFVQVSMGVVELSERDENFTDLLKRADNNLYKAKHNGRNKVMSNDFKDELENRKEELSK